MQDDSTGLWPVSSIIAECKAQARQTLDPGFTRFMNAAATALEAQSREIAELRETERRLSDGLALSRAENLRLRDDITQATAERDATHAWLDDAMGIVKRLIQRLGGIGLTDLRAETFLAKIKGTQND